MSAFPGFYGFLDFTGLPVGIPVNIPSIKGHGFRGAGKHRIQQMLAELMGEREHERRQQIINRRLEERLLQHRFQENQQRIFNQAVQKMNCYTALILEECT